MTDFESEAHLQKKEPLQEEHLQGAAGLGPDLVYRFSSRAASTTLQVKSLSPIALAYVGDAVYELYIRTQLLWPPQRPQAYHNAVVGQVRAEQQAAYLGQLQPFLSELEQDMVRRGRNAAPKRQRRVNADLYQQATSFETLIGYLYLTDQPRLFELLGQLGITPHSAGVI